MSESVPPAGMQFFTDPAPFESPPRNPLAAPTEAQRERSVCCCTPCPTPPSIGMWAGTPCAMQPRPNLKQDPGGSAEEAGNLMRSFFLARNIFLVRNIF